ncbi:Nuclear protein localization protein 4 [Pleurotus pulmonarius]
MLVRVRSKDGNFRFDLQPSADISDLVSKILETAPNADAATLTMSNQPRGGEQNVSNIRGRTLQSLGLKHGDLIFVSYKERSSSAPSGTDPSTSTAQSSTVPAAAQGSRIWETVQEDPVDTYWRSKDGMIPRGRDATFCKHGPKGMCDYCMPLEPYDAAYHKAEAIKHLSYHAYLRKRTPKSNPTSASMALPPLNPLDYRVKVPCPSGGHLPWPAGICTGCQPSAITLQSQPFRMVDHLEIASMDIVDRFLQAWRKTGLQRFGWMIGRYEPYDKVPMGVKAVVEAIHEPPQQGELDGLTLGLPWEDEQRILDLAKSASPPLTIVGYIFTDLDPTPEDRTKNVYKRHANSFYLSSLEAIFAATLQRQHPTLSRSSPTGKFESRLVTAVLTATEDGQVDVAAYQVSEQACAMVEADMIEASVDPGIVRVKEEDRTQGSARYVPDVFFTYKNEYGLEVKKSAKPCFPVEYLLVNVTHGFPQSPSPSFRSTKFSIENRHGIEEQQVEQVMQTLRDLGALNMQPGSSNDQHKRVELAKWLSDWHLVAFLGTTQLFSAEDMKALVQVASSPRLLEEPQSLDALFATEGWQTFMTIVRESAPSRPSQPTVTSSNDEIPQDVLDQIAAEEAASRPSGSGSSGLRICPHCTFENEHSGRDCEVCGLPL